MARKARYVRRWLFLLVADRTRLEANTLLADHLFSPSLLLAELIERGIIDLATKTGIYVDFYGSTAPVSDCQIAVVELGAGCALPSLLSATVRTPPSVVVITDYPDEVIMRNLVANVNRNKPHYQHGCSVHSTGYEWGQDTRPLL